MNPLTNNSNTRWTYVLKWSVLTVLLCLAVTQATLPFPTRESQSVRLTRDSERVTVAWQRWWAVSAELNREALRFRALKTLARWETAGSRAATVIDGNVARADLSVINAAAGDEWASVSTSVHGTKASVFFTLDTTNVVLQSTSRPLRGSESRYFALPSPATEGRCVALIRLRSVNAMALRGTLLGPCAFYASYGEPGPRLREWIEATGAAAARRSDLDAAQPFLSRLIAVSALPPSAGACLVRGGGPCLDALGLSSESRARRRDGVGLSSAPVPGLIGSASPSREVTLGERQAWFLADLARDIGRDRFERFWRSSELPEVAFRQATGMELTDWARRWLQRGVAPVTHEAALALPNAAWIMAMVVGLLMLSVRRRERVIPNAGRRY